MSCVNIRRSSEKSCKKFKNPPDKREDFILKAINAYCLLSNLSYLKQLLPVNSRIIEFNGTSQSSIGKK